MGEGTVLLACTLGCDRILALQSDIVGNRTPSVALCYPQGPKGPVRAGPYKLWGDAATRVEYADPDDEDKVVTHVIQLGVPFADLTTDEYIAAMDFGPCGDDAGPEAHLAKERVPAEDIFKDFGIPWRSPSGDIE